MRIYLVGLLYLLFIVNTNAQNITESDTLSESLEVTLEPLELIYHPIQKHFLYGQNKVVINQSSRDLAATFDDPSRVLYRHAGISMSNDQANAIVYRGLPSEYSKWSIGGAEIVNPNHLSNAGRISDQSSPSAGGVLAIPFEVINKFTFYGNAYGPEQTNAISGVSDLNFDTEGTNFYKVGLLGMEAGFQTKGKAKVKGNFRYSTVGLLSDFGVNFDGESIKFYDGFLKADISDKVSIIGIAGNSTNFHEALTNVEDASQLKDLQEIDFSSRFFIAGMTYAGDKYHHSLFVSQRKSSRTSQLDVSIFQSPHVLSFENFSREERKYSFNGFRKSTLWKGELSFGLQLLLYNSELSLPIMPPFETDFFDVRPYVNYEYLTDLGDAFLKVEPGLSFNHLNDIGLKFDPSLFTQLSYDNFILDFNFSIKNVQKDIRLVNLSDLDSDRVESYSLALKYQLEPSQFSVVTRLYKLDISGYSYEFQSILNGTNHLDFVTLFNIPNGSVINTEGIEFMIDKSWSKGWYTHANLTFFDSRYEHENINTDENFKSIYNFVVTKNIQTKKNNKWTFNLAYHQRGGAYQNSYDYPEGVYDERRLSTYYRIDARFQYTWKKSNILTLDIQNLTNRLNDGYYFFDHFLNEEVLEKQLGAIPILSYKKLL